MDRATAPPTRLWADWLAMLAVLCAAAGTLVLRELYHRGSSETNGLTQLAVAALLLSTLLLWRAQAPGRAPLALALAAALSLQVQGLWPRGLGSGWLVTGLGVVGLVLVMRTLARAAPARWPSLRGALTLAALLWFASPLAFERWKSPTLAWPPGHEAADAARDRGKRVTLFLLLDEFNAAQARPIADDLNAAGLPATFKAVTSVGPNTRNVVASLFSGQVFLGAQNCGPAALCTEHHALNLAKVHASRPDVDVVGFAHPYCAMQGLRSCHVATTPLIWLDAARLRCSLWRRTGLPLGVDLDSCRRTYLAGFADTTQALVDAALAAPALREGGVLFAHMQLPHPPGLALHGTLREHYLHNIGRARQLVRDMAAKAAANGLTVQAVVFSDHPLRQQLWCEGFAPYIWSGCQPDPALQDSQVPLIVAGPNRPDISALTDNHRVFSLAPPTR